MRAVKINTEKPYEVLIASGFLNKIGMLIKTKIKPCKACIITDDNVNSLYGKMVEKSLSEAGFKTCCFEFLHGEESKVLSTVQGIMEFMAENKLTRSDIIIALGGGVVGDTAGFAAACYMRGIRYVQVPTTLLAAVDSSVGGKTAVNLTSGKNLAGAFHQPSMVLCDTRVLDTLTKEAYASGVAEAIKCGILCDRELFNTLAHGNFDIENIIERCVKIKASLIENDEKDNGDRQMLNLGHTIGHAIEKCSDYAIPHGQAVAIGIVAIARAAQKLKIANEQFLDEIILAFEKNGLLTSCGCDIKQISQIAVSDKKRSGDEIQLVVPKTIGNCVFYKLKINMLEGFIKIGLTV